MQSMFLPACSRPECQAAAQNPYHQSAANPKKTLTAECKEFHKTNKAPCRFSQPDAAVQHVEVIEGSAALKATTASHIRDNMQQQHMLDPQTASSSCAGRLVAKDSVNIVPTIEHNKSDVIMELHVMVLIMVFLHSCFPGFELKKGMLRTRYSFAGASRMAASALSFLTSAFHSVRPPLGPITRLVFYVLFRATCSLHCDSSYLGYYSNSVSECLTIFCDVPVMIKVIKADLRMKIEGPRVHETADAYFFILRNGDTLVLHGAAGQVCAHQVFAPVGYMCIRIRTFLLKN